jgi:hypothetical protein
MSHFVATRTKIKASDIEQIRTILKHVGYRTGKDAILFSDCGSATADAIALPIFLGEVKEPNCGFRITGQTLEFISYEGDVSPDMQTMLQQVIIQYASDRVMKEAASFKQKGAKVNVRVNSY